MKFIPDKIGMFDYDTLTVRFGGLHSKPENIFTAIAVKVPNYTYTLMEQADAGGGCYYGYKEPVKYKRENAFIIIKDREVIGWMEPYHKEHHIKSPLLEITRHKSMRQIRDFALSWEAKNKQEIIKKSPNT